MSSATDQRVELPLTNVEVPTFQRRAKCGGKRVDVCPEPERVAADADEAAVRLMTRRRRRVFRDGVLAVVIALLLFAAWKLIAFAFALGGP